MLGVGNANANASSGNSSTTYFYFPLFFLILSKQTLIIHFFHISPFTLSLSLSLSLYNSPLQDQDSNRLNGRIC
ncbi:hypothetical protein RIF29_36713 [Crotalaria pallida]|uniref:Uncharacterized protein n=1 Tax=Crotalaria pallida TaxID=3830 RepID=A0AAN9EGZ7_CROPI